MKPYKMLPEGSDLLDDVTPGGASRRSSGSDSSPPSEAGSQAPPEPCCPVPKRYVIIILLFMGMVIVNAQRVNIGVTVVTILDKAHATAGGQAPVDLHHVTHVDDLSQLQWTPKMVGWLHSIFYVGLLISQVPCGYIVTKYPSHRLFGGCCVVTCALNFLLPVSIIRLGFAATCTVRLLQGLVEGLLYPSCYDVMRHWTMPEERSRMGASVLTGSYIGPTIGMILSGLLTYYLGWAYVFYIHGEADVLWHLLWMHIGAAGLLWYVFWVWLAFESPFLHPTISERERRAMEEKQGEATAVYENDRVPWRAIMTSLPVYALIVCNFARSFVFYMLLTNQPSYLNVFQFSIAENGLFASLPHAFMALFCVISGSVADYLWSQPWLTATVIRKLFTCLGFGIEAIFFFALALVSDRTAAVVLLTVGVGISGIAISGWQINHLDLAPRYAGVLVAITMTFGTLAGVTNPIIVAAMTEDQSLASWQNVFWMTGAVLALATMFYGVFGSGERQSWSVPRPPTERVVSKSDPLGGARKPYGTFHAQFSDLSPPATALTPASSPPSADMELSEREKAEEEESEKDLNEKKTTNFIDFSEPSASGTGTEGGRDGSKEGSNHNREGWERDWEISGNSSGGSEGREGGGSEPRREASRGDDVKLKS